MPVTEQAVQPATPRAGSAFALANEETYRRWREAKLKAYPSQADGLIVQIDDPYHLTADERRALLTRLRKTNIVIYQLQNHSYAQKAMVRALGYQFGLRDLDSNLCADHDSISSLQVRLNGRNQDYIPYTNRRLNWHTDGYYNEPRQRIRSFLMHCVQDAAEGGDNHLLDHEIAYLLIRDENPAYVEALMQPDAMTIPANIENGTELRSKQNGPIFFVEPQTGNLSMRYTARARNVYWKQDGTLQAAMKFIEHLVREESSYIFKHRLEPGQGILCNNVLHSRSAFTDNPHSGQSRPWKNV